MDHSSSKSSIHSLLGPSDPTTPTFAPSPSPPTATPTPAVTAYNPTRRITPARSVLVPISRIELIQCQNPTSNPLRIASVVEPHRPAPPASSAPLDSNHSNGTGYAKPAPPLGAPTNHPLPPKPDYMPPPVLKQHEYNPQNGIAASTTGATARKRPSLLNEQMNGLPQPKRRRSNEDVLAVVGHYNARPNVDVQTRKGSPIYGLKSFNNWIKSVLIGKYGRKEGSPEPFVKVLDLGCGKGGDLQKWAKAGTDEYIGIDVAAVSVEQAYERWDKMRDRQKFKAAFFALDCFARPVEDVLEAVHVERMFDVVSMQFCAHYAFDQEAKVRQMLENVVRFLKPGGVFIGTIPDSYNLLARLEEIPQDAEDLSFGNEVYRVQFDERDATPRFGHRYTFFLTDAVEEVPEYIVYWDNFVALAAEYGLKLAFQNDFQSIFTDESQDLYFGELLKRMKVVDEHGETEMTADQWEAANLYLGFAFVKEEVQEEEDQ